MTNKHDELLLKDLKLQPIWLVWSYIVLGSVCLMTGLILLNWSMEALLCVSGGFLIALGTEKLVSRRIRTIAMDTNS